MTRNILFDLGHPGHFHLFKNAIKHFKENSNYRVFVTTRNIPMIIDLLKSERIDFHVLGTKRNGLLGKFWSVIETDIQMLIFVLKNKIDLGLHCGIVLSHISLVTRMRSWIFDDDDDQVEPLMVKFSHPFSEAVFTPDCIVRQTKKAVYYPGTHELSYLYDMVQEDKEQTDPYSIVRLVAFNGHHDVGHGGLNQEQLVQLVEQLENFGKVFITSEKQLPERWEKYRMAIAPEKMHDFMRRARLVVGDSQTMISEAATMGVPAFKCNSFAGALSVPNMLEREYGLCFSFPPQDFQKMLSAIQRTLLTEMSSSNSEDSLGRFRSDKLNTSQLMIRMICVWKPDFSSLRANRSKDWLSLTSNFEPCKEISQ